MKQQIVLALILLNVFASTAQVISRGPYLQSPTHESVIVMWRTTTNTNSKVWYGTDPNNLKDSVFISGNVKDHTVQITGLQNHTKYYYKVGNSNVALATDVLKQYFTTHPIPGTTVPTRIWAIGDFGRGNAGQIAMKQAYESYASATNREADVWIWLGDNVYNDGKDSEYQQKVFGLNGFSDIFPHLPFYPTPGNHDYNSIWPNVSLLGVPYSNGPLSSHKGPYYDIVEVPEQAEAGGYPSNYEVFYSFDYGDIHFLSLNSELIDYTFTYNNINQMKDWIKQDLAQNTRKFTIAYWHQPPYTEGSHSSDDIYELGQKAMREKVIPLLEDFDIDLVICGHSHVYERSYLINGHYGFSSEFDPAIHLKQGYDNGNFSQGKQYIKDDSYTTKNGTVYVVCGNSGSSESNPPLDHPVMYFGHGASDAMGSFIIDVNQNRLDGKYLTKDGVVMDEFTIVKHDLVLTNISNKTICSGESITLGAVYTGGSDDISYSWSGIASTDSLAVFSPLSTTTYTLTVTDNLTGQVATSTFTINVSSPTQQPTITLSSNNGVLELSFISNGTYQWYLNGNLIGGATGQSYQPTENGVYTVVVTNSSGCSSESSGFTYSQLSSIENANKLNVRLYPNPAVDELNVVIPAEMIGGAYEIIDITSKVILIGELKEEKTIVNTFDFNAGVYHIILKAEIGVVKQNFTKH